VRDDDGRRVAPRNRAARVLLKRSVAAYERLSGLDACFLGFETPNAYMHVAVAALFEPGPLSGPAGSIDVEAMRAHVAARLPRLPRFRQRLLHVPVVRDPIWIDDERFDLAYHVRHASLPRPGSTAQLRQRCAEILERPLNRRRPLWELWVIEGLADGGFALVVKVHHCIVDGIAGIGMLIELLDPEPSPAPGLVPAWTPRSAPSRRQLLRDEVARRARATVDVGRAVGRALADPIASATSAGAAAESLWKLLRTGLTAAPDFAFNRPIGPHRQLAWRRFDLAELKAVARRLDGTINDVVLTVVGGAIGDMLWQQGEPVPREPLRAVIPVSIRSAEEMGVPGNRVSLWMVTLPVRDRDPKRRFETIHATTTELKRGGEALGGAVIAEAANWAGGAVVESAARWIGTTHLYNLIVTNVPGPSIPLYCAGARLREVYPFLPLFEQQGIGIALLSYRGSLHVGIAADWSLGAMVGELIESIGTAFDELALAAGIERMPSAPAQPVPQLVPRPARAVG
jgi:WS/DGAT/MGAT family acyltransferase